MVAGNEIWGAKPINNVAMSKQKKHKSRYAGSRQVSEMAFQRICWSVNIEDSTIFYEFSLVCWGFTESEIVIHQPISWDRGNPLQYTFAAPRIFSHHPRISRLQLWQLGSAQQVWIMSSPDFAKPWFIN